MEEFREFERGWNAGYAKAFQTIRNRSKGFAVNNQCFMVPTEALQDVNYAETEVEKTNHEVLSKEFERFTQFASSGNKAMYICVRSDGTSHTVTLVDGVITSRAVLADRVEV